jgi:hypothetical protein
MIDHGRDGQVWRQYLAERARQRCAAASAACEQRLQLEREVAAAHERLGELLPHLVALGDDPHLGLAWDLLLGLARDYEDALKVMDRQVEAMQAAIDDALLAAWPPHDGQNAVAGASPFALVTADNTGEDHR